jgi:hypothetical protein
LFNPLATTLVGSVERPAVDDLSNGICEAGKLDVGLKPFLPAAISVSFFLEHIEMNLECPSDAFPAFSE